MGVLRDTISMSTHFGEHITIDGYEGAPALLDDKKYIAGSLTELAHALGMHALDKIRIVRAPDNHIKDPGGWSAFMIIAESHISIHTFPRRHFLSADVYTCKNGIDADFVLKYFKKKFHLKDIEKHFIRRGTKYPKYNKF